MKLHKYIREKFYESIDNFDNFRKEHMDGGDAAFIIFLYLFITILFLVFVSWAAPIIPSASKKRIFNSDGLVKKGQLSNLNKIRLANFVFGFFLPIIWIIAKIISLIIQ